MATKITIPGSRELVFDGKGHLNPRYRRFFEEISGVGAATGDVLTIGDGGAGFDTGSTSTVAQDFEFIEFWRS